MDLKESARNGSGKPLAWGAFAVLYGPDLLTVARNVAALREAGARVLLVDNTPFRAMSDEWCDDRLCDVVRNGNRDGVAGAFEEGFLWAEREGLEWVLILDQSSRVDASWLLPLLDAASTAPDSAALFCPEHVEGRKAVPAGPERIRRVRERAVAANGNLVRVAAWKAVGGFDRALFIDRVDQDFCLKLGCAGYGVFRLMGAKMVRPPGGATFHRFFWRRRQRVANLPPARWYTTTRNRIRVAGRYLFRRPEVAWSEFVHFLREYFCMLLFEDSKTAKIEAVCHALVDCVSGRGGAPSGPRRAP